MNWRRETIWLTRVLAVFGTLWGSYLALVFIVSEISEFAQWVLAMLVVPIGCCSVWLIYCSFEWIILGFCEERKKIEALQNDNESR